MRVGGGAGGRGMREKGKDGIDGEYKPTTITYIVVVHCVARRFLLGIVTVTEQRKFH
jgi:hypothetical protein